MANGRMITKDICGDKRINQLTSDTSRLAFTWLITFCDREGRTHGDPAMVRSMLFPRRQDVSIEQMETIIKEWACLGLIIWYEAGGDLWIWFPGFDKNQPGLRKDKEAPSKIPIPTKDGTDLVRSRYGIGTDLVPLNRIEDKLTGGENAASDNQDGGDDMPFRDPVWDLLHDETPEEPQDHGPDMEWCPADVEELGRVFVGLCKFGPSKSERAFWIKSLRDLRESGISPGNLEGGLLDMQAQGLTIKSPASAKANALKNKTGGGKPTDYRAKNRQLPAGV